MVMERKGRWKGRSCRLCGLGLREEKCKIWGYCHDYYMFVACSFFLFQFRNEILSVVVLRLGLMASYFAHSIVSSPTISFASLFSLIL